MVAWIDPDPVVVDRLRSACRDLPEVTEHETTTHVVFRVGRRNVVSLLALEGPDGDPIIVLSVRANETEVDDLVATGHPFFRLGGAHGQRAIGMVIDADTDWGEVAEVVTDGYCEVAAKRLVAQLDLPE